MKYIEKGRIYDIEDQELRIYLTNFYNSIENLSTFIRNSNIVGTYSEIMVCDVLGLKKEGDSHVYTDAKGMDGKTYQIKSRWNKTFLDGKKGQNEFGSFKYSKDCYPFDFLILVYYEYNLLKPKVFKIKSSDINLLLENVARKKRDRVIFMYNDSFKNAAEQTSYICDISNEFEHIFN